MSNCRLIFSLPGIAPPPQSELAVHQGHSQPAATHLQRIPSPSAPPRFNAPCPGFRPSTGSGWRSLRLRLPANHLLLVASPHPVHPCKTPSPNLCASVSICGSFPLLPLCPLRSQCPPSPLPVRRHPPSAYSAPPRFNAPPLTTVHSVHPVH